MFPDLACATSLTCGELFVRLLAIGLSNGAVIALNAIGVTLVYSVVRMINFAHGDLFALLTVLIAWGVAGMGLRPELGPAALLGGLALLLGAGIGGGALLNAAVERIAFRPFRPGSRTAPLAATIGLSFVLYQVALLLRYLTNRYIPGEHRSVPGIPELPRFRIPDLLPDLDLLRAAGLEMRVAYPLKDLLVPLLAVLMAAFVAWLLRATRAGRALQACAQDAGAARLCGVNPDGAVRLAFMLGGGLAGAAAFVHTIYYTHPYTLYGAQSGLIAFTAAVLGGVGRPWGALVAGLLLGVVAAASDYFLAAQWTPVVLLGILMLLLLLRPTGLVAGEEDEEQAGEGLGLAGGAARRRGWRLGVGLLVLAALFPLIDQAGGLRLQVIATGVLVFAMLAVGLNLVLGSAGLLDLGYAACFAIGAYVAGGMTDVSGPLADAGLMRPDFLLVLAGSAAAAALFGWLNAALTLRLRGEYLAIVTLAFGQIVPQVILNLDRWTGGARGISALPPPRLLTHTLGPPLERYYLALALVALAALACWRLSGSRLGRAWAALSMDELAAQSCGIDRSRARVLVFMLGSGLAGGAGALFAACFSYVNPAQSEFRLSAMILAMVVIGGAGSVPGAVVGALVVAGYDLVAIPAVGAWLQSFAQDPALWWLAALDPRGLNFLSFGLALYVTVLLRARRPAERRPTPARPPAVGASPLQTTPK